MVKGKASKGKIYQNKLLKKPRKANMTQTSALKTNTNKHPHSHTEVVDLRNAKTVSLIQTLHQPLCHSSPSSTLQFEQR